MSYDELVKRLREPDKKCDDCSDKDNYDACLLCIDSLFKEAADAIGELSDWWNKFHALADMVQMPRWISVKERLPEEEESVFVVRKFLGVKGQVPPSTYTEIAYRIGDRWVADSDEYKIARHRHTDPLYWMPLPEPPKEET